MHIRRTLGALAVAALTTGAVLTGAGPAAAAGPDYCPDRYVCVYRDANWVHMLASWSGGETGTHNVPINQVSSWQNHSSWTWCAYDAGTNPDIKTWTMNVPNGSNPYVGSLYNDRMDYAKRC
jgi:Peptidase inhibitor family I36